MDTKVEFSESEFTQFSCWHKRNEVIPSCFARQTAAAAAWEEEFCRRIQPAAWGYGVTGRKVTSLRPGSKSCSGTYELLDLGQPQGPHRDKGTALTPAHRAAVRDK